MDVIRKYAGRKPMLGVCLGHQAIGEAFGAKLTNLSEVYHGVATPCTQFGNDPIFEGLPKRIEIGRYHSWVVDKSGFPDCLDITAVSVMVRLWVSSIRITIFEAFSFTQKVC